MTSIEPRIEGIEHLDHEPECSRCRKTAHFWVESHGCAGGFGCAGCLTKDREAFEERKRPSGHVLCSRCGQRFVHYEDCTKVVPL